MKIIVNKAKCKKCGDVIESKDCFELNKYCKCKSIFIAGGLMAIRRGGDLKLVEELSIIRVKGKQVTYDELIELKMRDKLEKVKAYILRCIKCNKNFGSKVYCNAKCIYCGHVHRCSEVEIIETIREKK